MTEERGSGVRDPLSLSPAVFSILLALSDGEGRHGYGISKEVQSRTDGGVKLGPGTLYGSIKRMISQGLIVEAGEGNSENPEAGADAHEGHGSHESRRRYYRITGAGRQTAAAEAQRLESLVNTARDRGLLTGSPGLEPSTGEV